MAIITLVRMRGSLSRLSSSTAARTTGVTCDVVGVTTFIPFSCILSASIYLSIKDDIQFEGRSEMIVRRILAQQDAMAHEAGATNAMARPFQAAAYQL